MGSNALVRNVGNIVNLSTPVGLVVALAGGARLRVVNALVVAEGVVLPGISASAMTIGSVVLIRGCTLEEATGRIPGLLEHEDHHAHQWAYCLGLPFIPLYMAATGWSWLRSADRAAANFFEVQAGLERGGYRVREKRSLRAGASALGALVSAAVVRRSVPPGAASGGDAGA